MSCKYTTHLIQSVWNLAGVLRNLLRIPFTINSKCIADGTDPEVKIIKKFDANNIPKIGIPLLREFRLYLAERDIKNKVIRGKFEKKAL